MDAKVLLVDDEEDFTTVLSERMETRGLQVDCAVSGHLALALVDQNYYDAVILDMSMPGMDGIETLRRMLARNPDLQVILLTGQATVEKSVTAIKLGAVEFLEKPADIDMLLNKIMKAQVKRLELNEKRAEMTISEIMKSKGW